MKDNLPDIVFHMDAKPHAAPPPNEEGTQPVTLIERLHECAEWLARHMADSVGMSTARTLHYDMAGKCEPLLMEAAGDLETAEIRLAFAKDDIAALTQQLAAAHAETERLRAANAKLRWEVRDAQENAWLIYRAKLVDPPNAPPAAKETNDE